MKFDHQLMSQSGLIMICIPVDLYSDDDDQHTIIKILKVFQIKKKLTEQNFIEKMVLFIKYDVLHLFEESDVNHIM